MAARRLIIVLIVLMAISTVAAVLAPPIEERNSTTSESTTATAPETGPDSAFLEARADAFGRPVLIGAVVGDRLMLTVSSKQPTGVRIPALGLSGFADEGSPAPFDLILREAGRFVVERDDGTVIAKIEVTPAPEAGRE